MWCSGRMSSLSWILALFSFKVYDAHRDIDTFPTHALPISAVKRQEQGRKERGQQTKRKREARTETKHQTQNKIEKAHVSTPVTEFPRLRAGAEREEGSTHSGCCSRQGSGRPLAACQQRSGCGVQGVCPPCPGSWPCFPLKYTTPTGI